MEGAPKIIISKVQQKQYLLYGILIGLGLGWYLGGFKGDMTGYLMVASVGTYIYYTNTKKNKSRSIYDVVKEVADKHQQETHEELDFTSVEVLWRGGDVYFMQFTNPTKSLTIKAPGVKGTREITRRSAQSLKTDRDNEYLDTKVYELVN